MTFANIARHTQASLKAAMVVELKSMKYKPIVKDGFVYAKGTVPVLLIAHMDTVHRTPVKNICYSSNGSIIMSPEGIGGDDRAGVYAILEIVKSHRCHVLFCEDEEIGGIGAKKFTKSGISPKVNFIVEIDRRGSNDAVFYDCNNPEFTNFVTGFGFEEEFGSFSDISIVAPDLGIAAVNISAGYFNEHTAHEYVDMNAIKNNIVRIGSMVSTESKKFEYIEASRYRFRLSGILDKYFQDKYPLHEYDYEEAKEEKEWATTMSLMELCSPNYVIGPYHEMHECDGDYLMDENGRVYEFNEYIGYAVEADGFQAFREHGFPAVFLLDETDYYEVISEDAAVKIEEGLYM